MTRPPSHEAPSSPHPLGSLKHQGTSLPSGNLRGSAAVPAWSKQQPLLRHVSRSAPGGPMQSTLSASGVDGEQPAEPVTFTWEFMVEPSANPGPAVVFTVTPASPLSEKARTRSARPSSDMDIGSGAVSMRPPRAIVSARLRGCDCSSTFLQQNIGKAKLCNGEFVPTKET